MSRARRAQKIAATAAYGGGGVAAAAASLGALGYGLVRLEAALARRTVGTPFDGSPDDEGVYGFGPGEALDLLVLGDSTAAGQGADHPHQTVGAIIANGVAALTGHPVRLTNAAVVGAETAGVVDQLDSVIESGLEPAVTIIMVGANDVTHRADRATSIRQLDEIVRRLRALGSEVVVGTCPDLGTVQPIAQPLRLLMRRWSRDLAAAQTVAVVEAGGRTVSLGDLLGPEFAAKPSEMFSIDQFHPSPAGYARAAAALLPTVCAALGIWGPDTGDRAPDRRRGEGIGPVAVAAGQAVREPGTEVSATEMGGQDRGPRGRWAVLLRRRANPVPPEDDPHPGAESGADADAESDGESEASEDHADGDPSRTPAAEAPAAC